MNKKLAWLAAAVVVAAFLSMVLPALARDVGQFSQTDPARREWFNGLRSQSGAVCCFDADGLDAEWGMIGSKFKVKIDGQWKIVPEEAVVTVPNRYGVSKVWVTPPNNAIRCFMPGPLY